MIDYKKKLPDYWLDPDITVCLFGNFTKVTKKEIKSILDILGIKWTIKKEDVFTSNKIITEGLYYPYSRMYDELIKEDIVRPEEFIRMYNNLSNTDMSEHSEQIIRLLQSKDKINIELAISLIDESMIEDNWIPWLYANKNITIVKEFLKSRNLRLYNFDPGSTIYDFKAGIRQIFNRFKVTEDYEEEFLVEFYRTYFK